MFFISNVLCLLFLDQFYHTFAFFRRFWGIGNGFVYSCVSSVSLLSDFIETASFFSSGAFLFSLLEVQCWFVPPLMIVLAKALTARGPHC